MRGERKAPTAAKEELEVSTLMAFITFYLFSFITKSDLPDPLFYERKEFQLWSRGETARAAQLKREEMSFSGHFSQGADGQYFTQGHLEVLKADVLPLFATYLASGDEENISRGQVVCQSKSKVTEGQM